MAEEQQLTRVLQRVVHTRTVVPHSSGALQEAVEHFARRACVSVAYRLVVSVKLQAVTLRALARHHHG